MAQQTKTSQRNPGRVGLNREQMRRGAGSTPAAGRPSGPLPGGSGVMGRGGRRGGSIINFIRDTRSELRKVAWPSQRETINLTTVVVALSVAVGLFLGAVDFIFQEFFRLLLSITGNGGF